MKKPSKRETEIRKRLQDVIEALESLGNLAYTIDTEIHITVYQGFLDGLGRKISA
jgi:hypothetical protein